MEADDRDPSKDRIQRMVRLPVAADAAWAAIGGWGALADWHPLVARVEPVEVGSERCRHVTLTDGAVLYEALRETGPRHMTYAMVDSPLPLSDHRATLSVVPERDGGCHVFWSAVFAPHDGADEQCDRIIAGVYEAGLEALRTRFGG